MRVWHRWASWPRAQLKMNVFYYHYFLYQIGASQVLPRNEFILPFASANQALVAAQTVLLHRERSNESGLGVRLAVVVVKWEWDRSPAAGCKKMRNLNRCFARNHGLLYWR